MESKLVAENRFRRLRFERMEPRLLLAADRIFVDPVELNAEAMNVVDLMRLGTPPDQVLSVLKANDLTLDPDFERLLSMLGSSPLPIAGASDLGDEKVVTFRSDVIDSFGNPATQLAVGEQYQVRLFVEDTRSDELASLFFRESSGVISVNVDLHFSDNLRPLGDPEFSDAFPLLQNFGSQQIDQVTGGTWLRNVSAVGEPATGSLGWFEEQLLLETSFQVDSAADSASILAVPTQSGSQPLLVFGIGSPISTANVETTRLDVPVIDPLTVESSPVIVDDVLSDDQSSTPLLGSFTPDNVLQVEPAAPALEADVSIDEVLTSFVPSLSSDLFKELTPDPGVIEKALDTASGQPIPTPNQVRGLLRPFFDLRFDRPDFQRFEFPIDPELDDELDDDDLMELEWPRSSESESPQHRELPRAEGDERDEERADESGEDNLAHEQVWSQWMMLEGEIIEPSLPRYRMRFQLYSIEHSATDRSPAASYAETGDHRSYNAAQSDDGMVDLTKWLRGHKRHDLLVPYESPSHGDIAQRDSDAMQRGSRGAAITFDVDHFYQHAALQEEVMQDKVMQDVPIAESSEN